MGPQTIHPAETGYILPLRASTEHKLQLCAWILLAESHKSRLSPLTSTQIGQTTGPSWQKCKCKHLFAVRITAVCVRVCEIPLFNGQIAKTDPTHNGGFMVSRLAD